MYRILFPYGFSGTQNCYEIILQKLIDFINLSLYLNKYRISLIFDDFIILKNN